MILKDTMSETYGKLILPKNVTNNSSRWASTGIITKKSIIQPFDIHDRYLMKIYQVGDIVAFNPTTPIVAPIRPDWDFANADNEKDSSMLIHVADIVEILLLTDEQQEAFVHRVQTANDWLNFHSDSDKEVH